MFRWSKLAGLAMVWVILLPLGAGPAHATEAYARKTGKGCIYCHTESTGGQLQDVGFAYIRNGYQYPIAESLLRKTRLLHTPFFKSLRFIIGYLHLLVGIVFFGAIFYIHIFIKPHHITGGLPKAERVLGLSCMVILALSGTYLTWVRIDRWEQFFNNTFGLMLFIKILLFILMVLIGLTAVTVIHRKMKTPPPALPTTDDITVANIGRFDGVDGKPAYFIHENRIYDVTGSPRWKDGRHFGKHAAGADLTAALAGAPHGGEVFERIKFVAEVAVGAAPTGKRPVAQRVFVVMAYTNLALIFLILACIGVWRWDFPLRLIRESRPAAIIGQSCVDCHRIKTPGIFTDWHNGVHGLVGVDCAKCHHTDNDAMILTSHLQYSKTQVSAVVTPRTCGECHPRQAAEYARSKHANTDAILWKIDFWLKDGMNNAVERTTGCFACHGTKVELVDGKPVAGTWPNVGVGRINPDGSRGSCTSCHTRHRFSLAEARKPEACDQCHLGPDHPQIEIYNESKHGTIYHAEGGQWHWDTDDHRWLAGRDFRAPTCAVCHMSAAGDMPATHDTTERLAWELQAPRSVRPEDFKPFPAATHSAVEREKMKAVCRQCHAQNWIDDHFRNLDDVVDAYNHLYYDPVQRQMNALYDAGLLSKDKYFDEEAEWQFYEFWHHEGRRARMGAAMMAPDYAWWHGFYELKHRYTHLMDLAEKLKIKNAPAARFSIPGRYIAPDGGEADHLVKSKRQ